jgi:gliding motility-associated lipoprotein GldH
MKRTLKSLLNSSFILFLLIATLSSCYDTSVKYHRYHHISGEIWGKLDTLYYQTPVLDSLQEYEFCIEARISDKYPYSQLSVCMCTNIEDAHKWLVYIAHSNGTFTDKTKKKWGLNNIKFTPIIIKPQAKRAYKIKIYSAMNDYAMEGISDLGILVRHPNEGK